MADSFRCIAALNHAAGRELTPAEVQDVFNRIQKTARDIADGRLKVESSPDLSSPEGIMRKAAELAAQEMIAEKVRTQRKVELQAAAVTKLHDNVEAIRVCGIDDIDAVRRLIANDADGRANQFSLEARFIGVSSLLKARVQDAWKALGSDFLGFYQDSGKVRDLIKEIRREDSGNPLAKKGAAAWLETADEARQWFNQKGGDIGHLDDWGTPQHHSQELVARAGMAQWMADIFPDLKRERYIDAAGNPMGETAIKELLEHAWWSIATNGANKIEPGKPRGFGARSNRHAEERYIHFKDADAVIRYWEKYGENTVPDILLGHLETMAKDIAFIEHFGPNPDASFRILRDEAESLAKIKEPDRIDKIEKQVAQLDNLYDYAAGKTKPVADRSIANTFDAIRSLNVAGKLGSAYWASFYGDKVMLEAVGRVNNLPVWRSWMNELRLLNPLNGQERRLLQRQGLMLDYMRSAMYRFGDDMGRSSIIGKMANAVVRVSGLSAINEWRRGAFGLTMMDALGHEVRNSSWSAVSEKDMHILKAFGIEAHDWQVWKLAELEDYGHGNDTMLTPEAIAKIPDEALIGAGLVGEGMTPAGVRRDAIVKLLGALNSESMNAIIEPSWQDRATMVGGLQRGNLRDEITRSFWQFKAFPFAQFSRMWDIISSRPSAGGKAGYLSAIMLMQTLAGAAMLQTQSLLSGEDPRPMTDWKFWAASFLKGGSLGLYGDFLYSESATTRFGTGPLEAAAGPTIGAAADTVTALVQAGNSMAAGKDTHLGAKLLNIGKGFIPGSNLWYTRAATDHLIFQNAQEALSPGYLRNMQDSARRQFHQEFWWEPGHAVPRRSPDLSNMGAKP